ncbi:MAG: hypothetical protein ACI97A_003070 [Planctomycetota bacterium]|jgi:hypothetical protein
MKECGAAWSGLRKKSYEIAYWTPVSYAFLSVLKHPQPSPYSDHSGVISLRRRAYDRHKWQQWCRFHSWGVVQRRAEENRQQAEALKKNGSKNAKRVAPSGLSSFRFQAISVLKVNAGDHHYQSRRTAVLALG